jgi:hypothetical protein
MVYSGDSHLWADLVPDGLVPDIIDLVLDSWDKFTSPTSEDLEVPITTKFCVYLRRNKDRYKLPFKIDTEWYEINKKTGEQLGRIDLRFQHGYRDDVYFAFECKRLNVVLEGKLSSLADKYVKKGMVRFVTGKYAKGLDKGGMVGYVMDGQLDDAILAVKEAVEQRRELLKMEKKATLDESSLRPNEKRVKETKHKQAKRPFLIHHIFLPVG